MRTVELSVAGKTFMAGEYLALSGGPALVLSTEPRFKLRAHSSPDGKNPFHSQSPAGRLWTEQSEFFSQYQIEFQDPYQVGGFGASSAQFALMHALWQLKEEAFVEAERFFDWHEMLADYRRIASANGQSPSGADIVGVVSGGLTLFERNTGKVQMFSWPFQEIDFILSHTGQKLATHEHLQSLQAFEVDNFEKAMSRIQAGLAQLNFEEFLAGLLDYRSELDVQGLIANYTREKIQNLGQNPKVLFAKGCGAMGSDVILTFCRKDDSQSILETLRKENLQVMAKADQISGGLQIRNLTSASPELSL